MRFLGLAFLAIFATAAAAEPKQAQLPGTDDVYLVSCKAGPVTDDYKAETDSGPSDRYAKQRGADKGLVTLESQRGKRVKSFALPRQQINGMVRVALDQTAPERVDLLYTAKTLVVVYTSIANAGIFTTSAVYELPYLPSGEPNLKQLEKLPDTLAMVRLGLAQYQRAEKRCAP